MVLQNNRAKECSLQADVREKRAIEIEEVESYANENGLIYMDTSAKTGLNIKEIFIAIGECRGF